MILQEKQTIICKNGEEIQGKWRDVVEVPDLHPKVLLGKIMDSLDNADVKFFSVLQEYGDEDKIVIVPASEVLRVEKLIRFEE